MPGWPFDWRRQCPWKSSQSLNSLWPKTLSQQPQALMKPWNSRLRSKKSIKHLSENEYLSAAAGASTDEPLLNGASVASNGQYPLWKYRNSRRHSCWELVVVLSGDKQRWVARCHPSSSCPVKSGREDSKITRVDSNLFTNVIRWAGLVRQAGERLST